VHSVLVLQAHHWPAPHPACLLLNAENRCPHRPAAWSMLKPPTGSLEMHQGTGAERQQRLRLFGRKDQSGAASSVLCYRVLPLMLEFGFSSNVTMATRSRQAPDDAPLLICVCRSPIWVWQRGYRKLGARWQTVLGIAGKGVGFRSMLRLELAQLELALRFLHPVAHTPACQRCAAAGRWRLGSGFVSAGLDNTAPTVAFGIAG